MHGGDWRTPQQLGRATLRQHVCVGAKRPARHVDVLSHLTRLAPTAADKGIDAVQPVAAAGIDAAECAEEQDVPLIACLVAPLQLIHRRRHSRAKVVRHNHVVLKHDREIRVRAGERMLPKSLVREVAAHHPTRRK